MGKVFVSKMFPPESKAEMVKMVQETLDVMRESITASDWLTDDTKDKAKEKLGKFRVRGSHLICKRFCVCGHGTPLRPLLELTSIRYKHGH